MVLCIFGWIKIHWIASLTVTGVVTTIGGLLMWWRSSLLSKLAENSARTSPE
jgi:hypothetical protein